MDTELLRLLAHYESLLRELAPVLRPVPGPNATRTQAQRTRENRKRAVQRKRIRADIAGTERNIVARCLTLRDLENPV